jgi:formylglycine-generating enzyme required for sulfatase activity
MSKAKNWAIVVGINKYPNIGQLAYANRDAEAMAAFFRSAGFDRVFCFTDELKIAPEPDQKSTLPIASNLVTFLHDRFTTKTPPLKAGDNCWFFFAGHGKRIQDADCLLPLDYNPRLPNHENFAIPVALVREALLKSGADNVILLLDACRTADDRDADAIGIGDEQPGAITIFSCERNKKAYEIEALSHGAFTAALLEGLQMPKSAANCATVQRLDRHLRDRVPQLCQQYQKPIQNPNTTVDPGQKWYFLLLPKVATEQDILALENKAQGAELAENWDLAEQLWIRCVAATGGEDLNALDGYARVRGKKANRRSTTTIAQLPKANPTASRSTPPTPTPPELLPAPKLPTFSFDIITVDATGQETDRRPGKANYFSENLGNGITLDMVPLQGCMFKMGAAKNGLLGRKEEGASDDEFPQHEVMAEGFAIGKFTITQAQWKAIANLPNKVKIDLKADPSYFKGANRPVENVSWDEAIEFCDRLSRKTQKTYRLPSEAQWEYACRAGTTTPFHFGETITTKLANFRGQDWEYQGQVYPGNYAKATLGEFRETTLDVGSFPPNAFGLYDMHGNVWEWCMDTWHGSYDLAPNDGSAWIDKSSESRLVRGGSWYYSPHYCRSANRYHVDPAIRGSGLGFRVICLPS